MSKYIGIVYYGILYYYFIIYYYNKNYIRDLKHTLNRLSAMYIQKCIHLSSMYAAFFIYISNYLLREWWIYIKNILWSYYLLLLVVRTTTTTTTIVLWLRIYQLFDSFRIAVFCMRLFVCAKKKFRK